MKIINAVITQATSEGVTLSLQLENSLANRIPGAWATSPQPSWMCVSSDVDLIIDPKYNGLECVVKPLNLGARITVTVKVAANVDRNNDGNYQPYSGEVQVEFVPSDVATQLGAIATSVGAVNYNKVVG